MERAELIALVRATGCAVEKDGVFLLGDGEVRAAREMRTSNIQHRTSNVEVLTEDLDPTLNAERLTLNAQVGGTGGVLGAKIENQNSKISSGWLGIATGGSSGGLKFARHDERTLTAAVRGFCAHFQLERVNAVDVLPAYHVSGLMARVRCAETGGAHVAWDWKRLEAGERPLLTAAEGGWVISLVPTQLQRLLASTEAVAWLRGFKIIFIGGGPVWPELAEAAARERLPMSLSYGMTETAAMVAALLPEEFLVGARSCGRALPHVKIDLVGDVGRVPSPAIEDGMRGEGTPPTVKEEGLVRIAGGSVFRGYFFAENFPEVCHPLDDKRDWGDGAGSGGAGEERAFVTEDLGRFDERGHLYILGRRDAVIITGGKKVQPADVESALRASGEFADVAVIGVPDAEWGEVVVACYPAGGRAPDLARAAAGLVGAMKPKRFVAIAEWPRNAQGKINRAELRRFLGAG